MKPNYMAAYSSLVKQSMWVGKKSNTLFYTEINSGQKSSTLTAKLL